MFSIRFRKSRSLNAEADKGDFQSLLLNYRREVGHWEGKRSEIPKAPLGFLTDKEKRHPAEPLSFNLVLKAWKTEYLRRFTAHVKAGGKVKQYYSVPLQQAAKRNKRLKPLSILTGKSVICSSEAVGYAVKFVNDGESDNPDDFWASTEKEAWYLRQKEMQKYHLLLPFLLFVISFFCLSHFNYLGVDFFCEGNVICFRCFGKVSAYFFCPLFFN